MANWRDSATLAGGKPGGGDVAGSVYQAVVTRVAGGAAYVRADRYQRGQEFGPCPILEGVGAVVAGDRVLAAPLGGGTGSLVILGREAAGAGGPLQATTKGDLLVATAAGTFTRVPVGAAGAYLRPNAAQAAGVEWSQAGARGVLAFKGLTANSAGFSAETTILTITPVIAANRLVRLEAVGTITSTVAGDDFAAHLKEGATHLTNSGVAGIIRYGSGTAGTAFARAVLLVAPSAGLHTYTLTCSRYIGTGSLVVAGGNTASGPQAGYTWFQAVDLGEASQVIDLVAQGIVTAEALGSHTVR